MNYLEMASGLLRQTLEEFETLVLVVVFWRCSRARFLYIFRDRLRYGCATSIFQDIISSHI